MPSQSFYIPSIQTHLIESTCVDQTYRVQVMQPLMKRGEERRFPVLYLTDANIGFDLAQAIAHSLQSAGQVQRFILVGIGYPGDHPFVGGILRFRDLTPAHRAIPDYWPTRLAIEGVPQVDKTHWHGADSFLRFITSELIPFIDRTYPTLPNERAYCGHSLGGGFGLHALFSGAGLFNRCLISSPGLSYEGDDHAIEPVRKFIASGMPLDARLFMSVGGEEEFEPVAAKTQFVSSFYRLCALLRRAQIPGLNFTGRIYPGETHVSVWPLAFTHGIQALYGPAELPPLAACAIL